jgi:hypothetical protein
MTSKAFGEQNPTHDETPVSWQTWSDGSGSIVNVLGDPNWGKLILNTLGGEGRSAVYNLQNSASKIFSLSKNRYGTGSGSATLQLRGGSSLFLQDDSYPDWEDYVAPIYHDWQYAQTRATTATYYFVDATSGSDTNTGLSPSQAWKTISKVNATTFQPGNTILFKRGETWREQLTVPLDGLTINSYGSGVCPKIYGSTLVSSWNQTDLPGVSADIFSESFNATGYDNAGWTEVVGAGSTVDEDSTDIADSQGGSTQILKIDKVSPNFNAMTRKDITSASIVYMSGYVYISSYTLSNSQQVNLFELLDVGAVDCIACVLRRTTDSGNPVKLCLVLRGSIVGSYPSSGSINTGQWYKIGLKYDNTNLSYDFSVDGLSYASSSMASGNPVTRIKVGDNDNSRQFLGYFDEIYLSSLGYYSTSESLPDDCWKSDSVLLSSPTNIWFVETGGSISHSDKKGTMVGCVNEYDWYPHSSGYLVIYSPTDPNSRYSGIEASQRNHGVTHADVNDVSIQNLDVGFVSRDCIRPYENSGWNILSNELHHAGLLNAAEGAGINIHNPNIVVRGNIIHDCGNHGITITSDNGMMLGNYLIEDNTFYDNYHSDVDLQAPLCTYVGTTIIRYNYFYNTTNFDHANYGNGGIYVLGSSGCAITGIQIYYNELYRKAGTMVLIRDLVTDPVIYNNTIYGTLPGSAQYSSGIHISTQGTYSPSGAIIKNNLVEDVRDACFNTGSLTFISQCDNNLYYQSASGTAIYAQIASTAYHFNDQVAYKVDSGFDTNGLWENALLVDPTDEDFSLQIGSPCRDNGVNVGITLDIDGVSVPQGVGVDIGAHEHIA